MKGIYIIAEIGQAHDGSLGIAHSFIDAIAEIGVNAVKFQTHIAEAESSEFEQFRIKFSYEDASRFDYWKRMEFTLEQWQGLKSHCEAKGLEFISSPFSLAAIELLEKLSVSRYKIGSGEIGNLLLLQKIAETGKPVILSSGMSSFEELDLSVDFFKPYGNLLSILQCTTSYPTSPHQWGLNVIEVLKNRYKVNVGFSDHSGEIYACLAAATLGAQILEFHVTFDKRMFGPDATSSLTFEQAKQLVKGVRQIEYAVQNPVNKNDTTSFSDMKIMFGKSLAVNKEKLKGEKVKLEDLESRKPAGRGIPAADYLQILGKRFVKDLKRGDFITHDDIMA